MTCRLWHLLLSLVLALPAGPSGGAGVFVAGASGVMLFAATAAAQSTRRSGGYGLPGGGGGFAAPARRPSASSGGYNAPAYTRRSPPISGYGGGGYGGGGYGGDREISRQSSGQALQQYRTSQPPPPQPDRRPSTGYADPWGDAGNRRPQTGGWGGGVAPGYGNGGWYTGGRGYPPYVPTQHFGMWDGLMLWGLLNTLSQPGRSQFFYSNQNDPGYQQWRTQMNAAAAQDPAIREKLDDLDKQVAQLQGQPKTPGVLPPGAANAGATQKGAQDMEGDDMVFVVLALGAGLFALFWFWRRQRGQPAGGVQMPAISGSARTRFRVGMTFPVDPTPFVLAALKTKVTGIDGEMANVEAVGVLMDGSIPLNRLYLPKRSNFFQLHLSRDGNPDECRYFSKLDEVSPASQEEWGVWLDPAQGLIGWPQFQTKDGKAYDRVWSPGGSRIPPRDLAETIQDLAGTTSRTLHAMLYGAPTGAVPPAPQTEYILVVAVEDRGQAWVEIHAGIDINPASLTLPSVSLT
jgi:hypothetical protein